MHLRHTVTVMSTNSMLFVTIVSSDGTVTREDDGVVTSQNRYEMIQVSSLPSQEMYVSSASPQVQPSYIIQSVQPSPGQTYIIQQPSGHIVRQTHPGQLSTGPSGLDTAAHANQV